MGLEHAFGKKTIQFSWKKDFAERLENSKYVFAFCMLFLWEYTELYRLTVLFILSATTQPGIM